MRQWGKVVSKLTCRLPEALKSFKKREENGEKIAGGKHCSFFLITICSSGG